MFKKMVWNLVFGTFEFVSDFFFRVSFKKEEVL